LQAKSEVFAVVHLEGQYPAQLTRGISRSIKLPPVLIQRGCYNSPTGYSGTATKFGQQPLRCKPVDVAIPDLTIISKHTIAQGLKLFAVTAREFLQPR
jgi:hypothetical protein